MDEKRTNPELKQLQILVWVWGYEKRHLKGHVFDDVPRALHQWKNTYGIRIFVYSSGMTVAQKLLFSCSNHGNILPVRNSIPNLILFHFLILFYVLANRRLF